MRTPVPDTPGRLLSVIVPSAGLIPARSPEQWTGDGSPVLWLMPRLRRRSYAFRMTDSPLSRQEIRAAAAAHDELGPEYSDAVVASFLEKVDKEIDARVNARLAGVRPPAPPAERDDLRTLLKGVAVGIGVSGIAFFVVGGNDAERLHRGLWVLVVLVALCTVVGGWAGRRLENRRAAIPRPGRLTELRSPRTSAGRLAAAGGRSWRLRRRKLLLRRLLRLRGAQELPPANCWNMGSMCRQGAVVPGRAFA